MSGGDRDRRRGRRRAQGLRLYVAIGDSFTAGTGCEPGTAWPERLAAALRASSPDLELVNLAVHGATSAEVASRSTAPPSCGRTS